MSQQENKATIKISKGGNYEAKCLTKPGPMTRSLHCNVKKLWLSNQLII